MKTRFVLERMNWRRTGTRTWFRLPGTIAIGTHEDEAPAMADRNRLEDEARRAVGNPFRCGSSLTELTSSTFSVLSAALREAGIELPNPCPESPLTWRSWSDACEGQWSMAQLTQIWNAADRVRFYQVRHQALPVLHCVVRLNWQYRTGISMTSECEGGTPTTVWYSGNKAASARDSMHELAVAEMRECLQWTRLGDMDFDLKPRLAANTNPFAAPPVFTSPCRFEAIPHCELMEVERGEPEVGELCEALGSHAFLVIRRDWFHDLEESSSDESSHFDRSAADGGALVRVFREESAAVEYREAAECEFRDRANPFRFGFLTLGTPAEHLKKICTAITTAGLSPPTDLPTAPSWYEWHLFAPWWDTVSALMTKEQRRKIWQLQEASIFFEVRKVFAGDSPTAQPQHQAARQRLYLVRATNWAPHRGPEKNPHRIIGVFTSRSDAERRRDSAHQAVVKMIVSLPVHIDDRYRFQWENYSSMSMAAALSRLVELGILKTISENFFLDYDWWEELCPFLSVEQRVEFWKVVDRVSFYEVLELDCGGLP